MILPGKSNSFILPGPVGGIEAVLDQVPERNDHDPVAVVCHPHPLFGGTLHNKVVSTVARTLQGMGVATLRFNFRGVEGSEGRHDQGRGEQEDLLAAVAWLRLRYPNAPLWLAGFSFGSAIALATWRRAGAERLLLIAPPVEHEYFPDDSVDIPWMVIMGGADEVVSPTAVSRWVSTQDPAPKYCYLEGAGHFFHRRLIDLRKTLQQAWGAQP